MARLLTLNEVIKELEELPEFMDWAVNYLSRKDTLSTYTHASSVTAILDYWMLDGELPFYECGELKRGKDILDALVYPDHKGDYQAGMESLLNTWKINPQELVALIQQEGFAQPECLKALAPIEPPALINHAGTEPKPFNQNSNSTDFSGLLNNPNKKDYWFRVIDDMTRGFHTKFGKIPNLTQAWVGLWENPPEGYEITTGKHLDEDCLFMSSEKPLSKKNFTERWRKYTAEQS